MPPPKPVLPPYATEIPARRPKFKMHTDIGKAKAAFSHTDYDGYGGSLRVGKLYKLVDGEWELVADIKAGEKRRTHPLWAESEAKRHRQHHNHVETNILRRNGPGAGWYLDKECPWCGKTGRQIVGLGP